MNKFIDIYRNVAGRINGNIVFVIVAMALGIATNIVYSLLLWFVSHFVQLTITSIYLWDTFFSILCIGGVFYFWRSSKRSANIYHETQKILELDERIYERLVVMHSSPQKSDVKQLIVDLLQHTVDEMFGGKVMRSFILLPDAQMTYLVPWVHYKMPSDGLSEIRFDISSDPHHRHGVAGTAFIKHSIEVAHIKLNERRVKYDHEQFVTFDEQKTPRYRSIICLPILSAVTKNTVKCTGVVCFDSSDRELFDGQETQQILKSVVKRIAEVTRIYSNIDSLPGDGLPPAA